MNNELKIIFQQKSGEKKNKYIDDISKKLKKIEKLNVDFITLKTKINTIRILVDEKTIQTKNNLCQTKEQFVLLLLKKYGLKGFTKWQKEIISDLIAEELEILAHYNYNSDTLQNGLKEYRLLQNQNRSEYEKDMMQESYKEMLSEFELEIDEEDSDFDFEKMNDSDFKKRLEEKIRAHQKKQEEQQKQFEKEQKIEKTDIDFQKIYKKLAKLAHPDLYKLQEEKVVKEEQMQRLTFAWDERDYYELLMLWLEIDPENTIELDITQTNQKNIIAQLNKKINEIEGETYMVKFRFEDTAFYYQFNAPSEKGMHTNIAKYIKTLDKNAEMTAKKHSDVEKTKTFKIILKEIYESNQEDDFSDFLNNLGIEFDED